MAMPLTEQDAGIRCGTLLASEAIAKMHVGSRVFAIFEAEMWVGYER